MLAGIVLSLAGCAVVPPHKRGTALCEVGLVRHVHTLNLATALLLGIGLIMALPVMGRQAAGAASQAPSLADRLFRVEWSAGAAGEGQSRIVGYVYNDYREER